MHQKFKVSWVVGIIDWPIKIMDNSSEHVRFKTDINEFKF